MGPISSPKRSGSEKRFLTSEPNPHFNTLYETVLLDRFQKVFPPTNKPAGYPASGKRKAAPRKPPAYSASYSVPQVQQRLRSPYPPSIFVT